METAIFAGGCFWCTEAIFQRVKGIISAESGYTGGIDIQPDYRTVSTGETNFAEALKIEFDPKIITYKDLLEIFFETHDPTTLNRQGNDMGTQYRSEIFYTTQDQKDQAEDYIKKLTNEKKFPNPIITKVEKLEKFYKAEDYHQNYFNNNQSNPYCNYVIVPKLKKLLEKFGDKVTEAI